MSIKTIWINLKASSQIFQRFWAFQFYNELKILKILLSAQKFSTQLNMFPDNHKKSFIENSKSVQTIQIQFSTPDGSVRNMTFCLA